jgi:hypothetical protein
MADQRFRWQPARPAPAAPRGPAPDARPPPPRHAPRPPAIATDIAAGRGRYDDGYALPDFRPSAPSVGQSQSEQRLTQWRPSESREPRRGRGPPPPPEPRDRDPRRPARPPPRRAPARALRSVSSPALAEKSEPVVTDWKPDLP